MLQPIRCLLDRSLCFRPERKLAGSGSHRRINRALQGTHNNLAERDVRMPKLKQKVSGCFRSAQGVAHFAIIRSYLSTLRKQSADIFKSLILTFQGSPPRPRLAPE